MSVLYIVELLDYDFLLHNFKLVFFVESSSLKTQKKKQGKCKTCDANNVPVAFLLCGHIECCNDCTSAMLKCPMCNVDIKQAFKRYLPYLKSLKKLYQHHMN